MKYEIRVGMTVEAPTFCSKPDSSTLRETLGKEDSTESSPAPRSGHPPETGERQVFPGREEARC